MEGLLVRHVVTVDGASKERLGSAIAMPHAQFPQIGATIVIVGDQADHLDTLSSVAMKLKSSS